ncbi:MAG: hypothetical protein KCHDKBKB_00121 [Elusimicrobia bacterium]|nr:hypothetical protein [Elusimicrobiota bacterium]
MVALRNLASQTDGSFELIKDLMKPLNEYAVQFLDPGEEANRKEAQRAIKVMEEARKFIREKIS